MSACSCTWRRPKGNESIKRAHFILRVCSAEETWVCNWRDYLCCWCFVSLGRGVSRQFRAQAPNPPLTWLSLCTYMYTHTICAAGHYVLFTGGLRKRAARSNECFPPVAKYNKTNVGQCVGLLIKLRVASARFASSLVLGQNNKRLFAIIVSFCENSPESIKVMNKI